MSDYGVHGKKGTGKSKFAVWRIRDALLDGRRVATNLDLYLDKLVPNRRCTYTRLPDRPLATDLEVLGRGYEGPYNEDKFGVLVLDELATWLNARSYADKDRQALIDWLVHARKLGWDCYYLVQGLEMIDKQVRGSLIEYDVRCMRMDKVKVPFIGSFLSVFHKRLGYLPKFHSATARLGTGATAFVAERWHYLGHDLHDGYNTEQVFDANYPHGVHTVLPPWEFQPRGNFLTAIKLQVRQLLHRPPKPASPPRRLPPKRPVVAALERCLPPDQRIAHVQRLVRLGLV